MRFDVTVAVAIAVMWKGVTAFTLPGSSGSLWSSATELWSSAVQDETTEQLIPTDEEEVTTPTLGAVQHRTSTVQGESRVDLERLAVRLNPLLGYYDPIGFVDKGLKVIPEQQFVGWLRQSEIKHGRIAMFAFVGYCVQSVCRWPWAMTFDGEPFPAPMLTADGLTGLSPPEQWDALPLSSKLQIIFFIGCLEWYSELSPCEPGPIDDFLPTGQVHYTKGGKPGTYPSFEPMPHVAWNLYDPLGLGRFMNEKTKERRLLCEINNGRLAMVGMMGFLSEQLIPGSVPVLKNIVTPYSGNIMAPFEADFHLDFQEASSLIEISMVE